MATFTLTTDHKPDGAHLKKKLFKTIQKSIFSKHIQFEFRKGLKTREAMFAFNILLQKCLEINQNLHMYFMDYNKIFDKVRQYKTFRNLSKIKDMPEK